MTATARAAVAQRLTADGIAYALDRSESLLPEFRGGRIAGKMNYSVGVQMNPALPTLEPINLFAQANGTIGETRSAIRNP